MRAERNILPNMRRLLDWSDQLKQEGAEDLQTQSNRPKIFSPYLAEEDITRMAKDKEVKLESGRKASEKVDKKTLNRTGKEKRLTFPFSFREPSARCVATPEVSVQ